MKKQLKKSLSLCLAVLMMLSCWVWVAPQKAEAATSGYYPLTLVWDVSDQVNGGSAKVTVTYTTNNGTGTSTSKTYSMAALTSSTGSVTWSDEIPGFPTNISITIDNEGMRQFEMVLKSVAIAGRTIGTGDWTFKSTWGSASKTYPQAGGGDWGTVDPTTTWTTPFLNTVTSTLDPTSHTLAKINSGTNSTSTITLSGFVDDYGIDWLGTVTPTFTLRVDDGITLGSNATITGSGNSRTITIKPWFQTLYPGKQNAKLYIDWTATGGTGKKTGTETITVDFPTYTVTFDANGGKIGADDTEAKDQIVLEGDKMNIGSVIGKAPAYATKPGFEFKGFYSQKNDDATGLTASFSGTKFVDDETTIPAATSGNGDTTWYAAWQALPITATFLTADNQLIGTVEGRYNNYMTASNMYNGDAGLNAAVKAAYTGSTVKFNSNNEPIYTDGSTTYTFAGWKIIKAYDESVVDGNEDTVLQGDVTFQAVYTKADAATYTVSFEDGNGTVISTQSGYKYRDDVTNIPANDPTKDQDDRYDYEFIGWAKDIGKNFYVVDEYDNDENGAKIVYTHKDGAEFIVKGDASYVPVFRMIPREYNVTYNYTIDGGSTESTVVEGFHWHDTPTMPEIKDNYTSGGYRYYLIGWNVGNDTTLKQLDEIPVEGDMSLTAVYGNREAAKYTINFYGKDVDGVTDILLNGESNIYEHDSLVTAPEVPQTIDTEDALYTFAGWSPAVNTTAGGDVDYYATYTKKTYADVHFYNYDGTLIYELDGKENSLFVGETIPAYSNIDEETSENVLPTKAEDVVGTYNFTGWADGSGNEVLPGTDLFTGDTYLYAQFDTVYKEYTVKFVNEGTTVSEETYHYGVEIVIPDDPTKAEDVEYIYDFKAWSPDVSEVCYGDATYEATYRRTNQYYTVTWFNDNKAVHSESNYTYNAKIQQAVINDPVDYPDPEVGKEWAFKHWVQCDENGNDILADGQQIIFSRGQRMPAEHLYFYPVFEEVDRVHTVKFYKEDGTTPLGEAKIPYGELIADYADAFAEKAPKLSDDTYHYIINEWVNVNGGAAVTTVTADVSVKATYTAEAHNKQLYEVVAEPTCNVPGYGHYKCDVPQCTAIDYNVAIAPIADESAPTGQIYVGTNKWTLDNFLAGIDYSDIKFVGPNTHLIVNAEDTGTRSKPWNLEGELSRGVGKIEYYLADEKLDDTSTIISWTEIYNYEEIRQDALNTVLKENNITLIDYNGYIRGDAEAQMKKAEIDRAVDAMLSIYNANATGVVSNLNLVDGEDYVIYIRVSDREGNGEVNTCVFSSGTISYGATAPEIAVAGEGYGTKFCADATVTVTDDEDGFTVYLDGTEETLTDGKFTCDTAGVHTVTVIDKHGNKTTKTFEIKGSHTYRNYTVAATCENAGSRYDLCTLCGYKANETELPALGHSYTANFIDKAPTCVDDGYRTYVCDNNCGTKLILKPTDDAETLAQAKKYVEPAEDEEEGTWVDLTAKDLEHLKATNEHTYAKVKDENGEDTAEDAWVIDKAATCSVVGSKHKDCTKCGIIGRVTEEIPVDKVNGHKFYREKVTLEPTCTEKGEKTKTCRYCGEVVKTEDIDALGHVAGEYKVMIEPTCEDKGSKILTCKVCGVNIGEPVKDKDGEFSGEAVEIPALGHAWKIDGEVYSAEETDDETGEIITVWYQNYVCNNDSKHTKKEKLEDYKPPVAATVTFDFNGGYYVIPAVGNPDAVGYEPELIKGTQTISTFVGESIIATDIKTAIKQDTATCKYTFSHWATKNDDGTYTEVKFPIEVKGDATYYAVYAEKYINYTITYYAEDGKTEIGKTGYLHNGEEVTLDKGPSKADTVLNTYEFAGWALTTDATKVYAETIKIDGANINLKATYTEKDRYYAVTYAYDTENILETFLVKAGTPARDCFETPTKAYDSVNHYTFKAWDKAEQLKSVTSNIYTTPTFTAEQHIMGETVKTPATCTENEVKLYVCKDEACEYSYEREIANSALGHEWVYNEEKGIFECSREGCDETTTKTDTTYTITYYNAVDKIYTHSYGVSHGAILNGILPEGPSKAADKEKTYTFKHWATKDDEGNVTELPDNYEVKSDLKLYPVYEGETRTYTVIFAYNAGAIIGETSVDAGDEATWTGAVPTKDSDSKYHYTFSKWNKSEELKAVYSDIYTTPNFTHEEHKFTATVKTPATCTTDRIDTYACTCGYSYDKTIPGTALGHEWGDPTTGENGETIRECTRCDATTTEGITHSIVYYNAKGEVYTRAYNIVHGTALKDVLPVNGPSKAADKEYTYTFKGWATKDDEDNLVPVAEDATVTAALNLYPLYDSAKRSYTVKFLNATGDVVYEATVDAGAAVTCPADKLPTKNPDNKYHYSFKAWEKAEELKAVYSNVVTSAVYTSEEHTMTGKVTTEATCQIKEVKTFTCSGCDYTYTKEGALGTHIWGDPVTADGVTTRECVYGCGEKTTSTAVYAVKYYADKDATEAISTKTVEHGTKFAEISVTTPTKAKDDENTYAFSHWALKSDATGAAIADDATVTGAMEVVAVYKATARLYTVIFGLDADNTLAYYTGKTFAEISPDLYDGEVPTKAYDNYNHYTFKEWKLNSVKDEYNSYTYYADFTATAHTLKIDDSATVEATCTTGASILKKCEHCEYSINLEQGRPLGHKEVLDQEKSRPAEQGKDGENVYKCDRCGIELRRETTKWQNPEEGYITIKLRVKDTEGNPIQGAKVELYSGSSKVAGDFTDSQGYVTFRVPKGEYTAIISDVKNADPVQFTVKADKDGEITSVPQVAIRHCGCACHRDNIWGTIFRFFHKIIKMITGEFKCCKDPSDLY